MTKTLPCRVCGKTVPLSEKYAGRARSAVCLECAGKTPSEQQQLKRGNLKRSPAYISGQILGLFTFLVLPILLLVALSNPQIYGLYEAAFKGFVQGIEAGSECRESDPMFGGC